MCVLPQDRLFGWQHNIHGCQQGCLLSSRVKSGKADIAALQWFGKWQPSGPAFRLKTSLGLEMALCVGHLVILFFYITKYLGTVSEGKLKPPKATSPWLERKVIKDRITKAVSWGGVSETSKMVEKQVDFIWQQCPWGDTGFWGWPGTRKLTDLREVFKGWFKGGLRHCHQRCHFGSFFGPNSNYLCRTTVKTFSFGLETKLASHGRLL